MKLHDLALHEAGEVARDRSEGPAVDSQSVQRPTRPILGFLDQASFHILKVFAQVARRSDQRGNSTLHIATTSGDNLVHLLLVFVRNSFFRYA